MVKDGKPTVEIPPAAEFSDLHHQATSVVQRFRTRSSTRRPSDVGRATEAGRVDQAAVDRVAAYEAPVETRLGGVLQGGSGGHLRHAEPDHGHSGGLRSAGADAGAGERRALGEDDGSPGRHVQGVAGHHGHRAGLFRRPPGDAADRDVAREATQQKRAEARQGPVPGVPVAAAPATPEPKPTRVGGDPELGAAPQRGGAGGAAATSRRRSTTRRVAADFHEKPTSTRPITLGPQRGRQPRTAQGGPKGRRQGVQGARRARKPGRRHRASAVPSINIRTSSRSRESPPPTSAKSRYVVRLTAQEREVVVERRSESSTAARRAVKGRRRARRGPTRRSPTPFHAAPRPVENIRQRGDLGRAGRLRRLENAAPLGPQTAQRRPSRLTSSP